MSSYPPQGFIPPAYQSEPPGRRGSYGPEIVDFTAQLGHPVDAEQASATDVCAALGPGGKYLAFETCVIEGRQNGKTDRIVLPHTMFDFFVLGVETVTWTAHLMDTTLATFKTVKRLIDANPMLSRRVKAVSESKSEQGIELMSGALWDFRSRVAGGGRGRTGDIWVADEALILDQPTVGARLPTLRSRPNPQVRYASSAGLAQSAVLRNLVKRGRAGGDDTLAYIERCAPGSFADPDCEVPGCRHGYGTRGCTLDREELWHLASHAMGRRISYAVMRSERKTMEPAEFARELLGWHEVGTDAEHPISSEDWEETQLDDLEMRRRGPLGGSVVFVLDVAPGMRSASIGVCGRYGDVPHAELAGSRLGSDWAVPRLVELKARHPRALIGFDSTGAAPALMPTATQAGLTVQLLDAKAMCSAAEHIAKLSLERAWTHPVDPILDQAYQVAVKREIGDGRWDWGRRKADGDITPLRAVGGALWLVETVKGAEYDLLDSVW